jgi:adenylate kinase
VAGQGEPLAGGATFVTGNPPAVGTTFNPRVFVVIVDEVDSIVMDSV